MGISGLLIVLKSIHKHGTLKKYAGQTIGIDAYGWLHRGTAACAIELALDKPTTKYVDFAMSRVRMLLDFGIIPYLVFDGDALPSKAGTNADRRKMREESKALGLELYKAGKRSQAQQELQKAAGVTHWMARQFIDELKRHNVQYVVAPYEADAQLAYLERKGIIDAILSEDSDLLVFGAKRLITKLNQYGECVEIDRADFASCRDLSLAGWNDTMFRRWAILSGCDYLPNVSKMGLKTAYRYVRKYRDTEKFVRMIQLEGFSVPAGYLESFYQAERTFLHHRVFCPVEQKLVLLTELPVGLKHEDLPYLGPDVEADVAVGVACGDLDPKTKEPMVGKARRPAVSELRRQTLASAADLKPKKSIDSFFKSSRVPLAELDPNSLTPSPSQQRLLRVHANASWEPRTISSAPQLRRMATMTEPPSSAVTTDRGAFLARASTISNFQPTKRQRLCSESEDLSPSQEVKHSRFFAGPTAPSPLAQKKGRSRKAGKSGFDVWSDDSSIDDALLSLPDVQELASPDRVDAATQLVGEEDDVADVTQLQSSHRRRGEECIPQSSPNKAVETGDDTSQAIDTRSTTTSQGKDTTPVNPDDAPEAFEDLLEWHVRKQNESLSKTFLLQSPEQQVAALESLSSPRQNGVRSPSPVASRTFIAQSPERRASALASLDTALPTNRVTLQEAFGFKDAAGAGVEPLTLKRVQSEEEKVALAQAALASSTNFRIQSLLSGPASSLQRLGHQALRRRTSSDVKKSTEHLAAAVQIPTPPATARDNNVSQECATADSAEVTASSSTRIKGSEDFIVPDSDDDGLSSPETRPRRSWFDFKAFAFTPT